jgi:hypothetical protein
VNLSRLTTVAGLAALHIVDGKPLFPEATVRGWIAGDLQGFRSSCIIKMGGRTMVDLDALETWLEAQRGGKATKACARRPAAPINVRVAPTADLDAALASIGLATTAGRARRQGARGKCASTA